MDAFIKKDKRDLFKDKFDSLGFGKGVFTSKARIGKDINSFDYYYRNIDEGLILAINKRYRLMLVTPMGESPFMESQKQFFQDLLDLDYIEFRKNQFD